jgi:cytochrome c5
MKKLLLSTITLMGLMFLVNCSPKTTGSMTTKKTEAAPDGTKSTPMEEIDEGKLVWRSNCDKCHKLYDPTSRNKDEWEKILPIMGKKAKLTDKQVELVKAYIFKAMEG